MIQPQELRIGNYVFDIDGDVLQIGQILDIGVKFKNTSLGSRYEKINPIPLTEEILLKFGFEKKQIRDELKNKFGDYAFSLNNIPFYTLIEDNDGFMLSKFETYITTVVYVHQLQNLYFNLTGEELTFKNPLNFVKNYKNKTKCYCGHTIYCDCSPLEKK